MILFRFRRFLRYYGLDWHLKILFEYNVPPLIIRVKTYTLRKKLLLSYQKEKITIFSSNIAKKAKIGFFFLFQWRFGTWRYYPNELKMDWYAYYDLEQLLATITCQVSKIIFFAPPYSRGNGVRKPCTKCGWREMNGSSWNQWPKVVWNVYNIHAANYHISFFFSKAEIRYFSWNSKFPKNSKHPSG